MSLSIRLFDRGTRATLIVVAVVGLLFVGTHVALDAVSRYAERNLGAYLWKEEDFLRLFSPAYHEGRGRSRLLIYGPSEAREGLLPEELARRLPHLEPYQGAQSWGTLEDMLVMLDYLEKAYGASAIPEVLLLGITPRFISDIRVDKSRLLAGINRYSPHFKVAGSDHPPALAPKSFLERFQALLEVTALEPDRYRRGLFAVLNSKISSEWLQSYERTMIRAAKYRNIPSDPAQAEEALGLEHWERVHGWDPENDRARIAREIGLLLAFVERFKVRLYVVNLPEHPATRARFQTARYASYLRITRDALRGTPFLDLRESLAIDEFYDETHVTWKAAIKVADTVGAFVSECEAKRTARR